ncbi:PREDICTED: uncharacterized protein LOC105367621 [Ceratosolen solmsi marchali]|uniref:Uncharacterized protein LOC105367621 n=1 Tax=Ceratosolen solmsi marchali TaxID=326594 RepID=A0AAJ6YUQ6_9HYME|nr:PREDICTED: uncharacterized protein LOC105367621 [Ceratosolen solmsi marchali]
MSRLKVNLILSLLMLNGARGRVTKSGSRVVWDDSRADRADYYPASPLIWPRLDNSPLLLQNGNNAEQRLPIIKRSADITEEFTGTIRERRGVATDASIEKSATSKGLREARMSSPETWSQQSSSAQFRHRGNLDQQFGGYEGSSNTGDSEETANFPIPVKSHYAPKTDFVTSARARTPIDARHLAYLEGRESRDVTITHTYDEYDVPIFRNIVREHDFDVQIPRNYYYPNRYGAQRDYYYRGSGGGAGVANPYVYDRYRDEEEDYELYGRFKPTPKPKRIIYYATLPEIVRKPVDLRNYPRPYDAFVRPEIQVGTERNRVTTNTVESSRRPPRYPYDNYDNYVKRSSYYDRRKPPYAAGLESRPRGSDRSRLNYKDKMRNDDQKLENQISRSGDNYRLPWSVQIGTELNVKDNERIPGRKIFGQIEDYERYEGSRVKMTSENIHRKEDKNEDDNNNNNTKKNHSDK